MSRPKVRPTVYDLDKENHFIAKVSTNTTDIYPEVVFLRAKVKVTPSLPNKIYENDILQIKREFENFSKNLLNFCSDYDKNYIFSVDISEKSVKYKKMSHLKYDVYLKPRKKMTLEEHKNKLSSISDKMDNKLIELFKKYDLIWK